MPAASNKGPKPIGFLSASLYDPLRFSADRPGILPTSVSWSGSQEYSDSLTRSHPSKTTTRNGRRIMKSTFFLFATLSTALPPAIVLAATTQSKLQITGTSTPAGVDGGSILPADRNAGANWSS